jgi:hypothetical protein
MIGDTACCLRPALPLAANRAPQTRNRRRAMPLANTSRVRARAVGVFARAALQRLAG